MDEIDKFIERHKLPKLFETEKQLMFLYILE